MNQTKNKEQHVFPQMAKEGKWVGVAFRNGSMYSPYEAVVMSGTMGPFVHCELILGDGALGDVYASYNDERITSGFCRSLDVFESGKWVILKLPVKSLDKARGLTLRLMDLQIPYNQNDLWQCCIKAILPFETELSCDNADEWKKRGVFCSQMCLLFLRMMQKNGDLDAPDALAHHLSCVHSRGCSPNMLYSILSQYATRIF